MVLLKVLLGSSKLRARITAARSPEQASKEETNFCENKSRGELKACSYLLNKCILAPCLGGSQVTTIKPKPRMGPGVLRAARHSWPKICGHIGKLILPQAVSKSSSKIKVFLGCESAF